MDGELTVTREAAGSTPAQPRGEVMGPTAPLPPEALAGLAFWRKEKVKPAHRRLRIRIRNLRTCFICVCVKM